MTDYSELIERLSRAEKCFLAIANGDITAPEALHAEACYRAAEAIRTLQTENECLSDSCQSVTEHAEALQEQVKEYDTALEECADLNDWAASHHAEKERERIKAMGVKGD